MREAATTLLEIVGIAAVVTGVALIFIPAAFITAGLGAVLLSWSLNR